MDNKTTKRWAIKYSECVECKQSTSAHAAKGLCDKCWTKAYHQTEGYKKKYKQYFQTYYAKHKEDRKEKMINQSAKARRMKNHLFTNWGQFGL